MNFNGKMCGYSVMGDSTKVVSQVVGGRTAITCTDTTGDLIRAMFTNGVYGPDKTRGSVMLSSSTPPTALYFDGAFALPTLSFSSGTWASVGEVPIWNGSDNSQIDYLKLMVTNDNGTYKLYFVRNCGADTETVLLGTVTQGTTYTRVVLWVFRDKVYYAVNGAALASYTYIKTTLTVPVYPETFTIPFLGDSCVPAWDYCTIVVEEFNADTTLNKSTTNGNPDNGTLFVIQKTALQGLITAGTAHALAITNGTLDASSVPNGFDYLICKVNSDNDNGFGVKVAKDSSGNVDKSNWSIS